MKIDEIKTKVEGIPYMDRTQAETITNIILENNFNNILELGFAHGVSTCYMAGALDKLGSGKITTIDLEKANRLKPNIEQLLNTLGLAKLATVLYELGSYN
ncbi:MAG: hypothetical protein BRC50_11650 [Cyanobacteria bacterium SW_11_48_12]|nr:MAG: hypothetical protein BRC50_11650 [Cyanobacteria bacterium SW_11_48_12]